LADETVLIRVTGPDRPGITVALMRVHVEAADAPPSATVAE